MAMYATDVYCTTYNTLVQQQHFYKSSYLVHL